MNDAPWNTRVHARKTGDGLSWLVCVCVCMFCFFLFFSPAALSCYLRSRRRARYARSSTSAPKMAAGVAVQMQLSGSFRQRCSRRPSSSSCVVIWSRPVKLQATKHLRKKKKRSGAATAAGASRLLHAASFSLFFNPVINKGDEGAPAVLPGLVHPE